MINNDPAPTIGCALHNVLEAATNGPQSNTSLTDFGRTTARSRVKYSPSIPEGGTSAPPSQWGTAERSKSQHIQYDGSSQDKERAIGNLVVPYGLCTKEGVGI